MLPKRAIVSVFPTKDADQAALFVRSLLRQNTLAYVYPSLKNLYDNKDDILDDATVLLIDARSTLLLRDPTALFEFYEKTRAEKQADFLYSASPKYDPSTVFSGQTNASLMPGLCIMTGGMLKQFIEHVENRYGPKLHEQRTVAEADLNEYVKHKDIEVVMDNQRRFLVYPKYRLDVGCQLIISEGHVTYQHPGGNTYSPFVLTRCGHGELRAFGKRLGYGVDGFQETISDHMEKWYKVVRSYFV